MGLRNEVLPFFEVSVRSFENVDGKQSRNHLSMVMGVPVVSLNADSLGTGRHNRSLTEDVKSLGGSVLALKRLRNHYK